MNRETITLFVLLASLTSLFLWSPWACLAGIGAIVSWYLWLYSRELSARRALRRRRRAQLEQGFAAQGLHLEAEFHGQGGYRAIGVAADGKFICCTSTEGV
ncbi:MAG TPA: hypothetical protein VMT02_02605, partial [Burkholderiales bacterium]|nr:hypothetical protein [Burkholderiales bacterium]